MQMVMKNGHRDRFSQHAMGTMHAIAKVRGPLTSGLWAHNWNLMKNSVCSNFDCIDPIRGHFCRHLAVVASAKLWHDWSIIVCIKAECILMRFGLWTHKTLWNGSQRTVALCKIHLKLTWSWDITASFPSISCIIVVDILHKARQLQSHALSKIWK